MNRNTRQDILDIFYAGLDAADPKRAVTKILKLRDGELLKIGGDLESSSWDSEKPHPPWRSPWKISSVHVSPKEV